MLKNAALRRLEQLGIRSYFRRAQTSSRPTPGGAYQTMTAKMPASRVNVPVPLSQLAVGDSSYILFTDLIVDQTDLSTYINPEATLRNKEINTVGIRREEDGFHIEIHHDDMSFTPVKIPDAANLIPTAEISERIRPNRLDEIDSQVEAARRALQRRNADRAQPDVPVAPETIPGVAMPAGRIKLPDRFVPDLQIDETGHVEFTHFRVGENGSTYVDKGARLQRERHYFTVVVIRRTDGLHARLISKWTTFKSAKITNYEDLIPIIDITDGPNEFE